MLQFFIPQFPHKLWGCLLLDNYVLQYTMNLKTKRRAIQAKGMLDEGYKMGKVVEVMGVSRQRIWQWLKKINESSPLTIGK